MLFVFFLLKLSLILQYFSFADQRAEFVRGIEKNVSVDIHFSFRVQEFGSVLSGLKVSF